MAAIENIGTRVTRLESTVAHLATKADLYRITVTIIIANAAVTAAVVAGVLGLWQWLA